MIAAGADMWPTLWSVWGVRPDWCVGFEADSLGGEMGSLVLLKLSGKSMTDIRLTGSSTV